MFKARSVVKPAQGAVALTLVVIIVTLLTLTFSTGSGDAVERKAFFGSMFFERMEKNGEALNVSMGIANPIPLIILFLALTAILTIIQAAYGRRTHGSSDSGS